MTRRSILPQRAAIRPWHNSLRDGEMQVQALAELPDLIAAIPAVNGMSREDLESIVIERLYCWHAGQMGPVSREFRPWVYSDREPDSS